MKILKKLLILMAILVITACSQNTVTKEIENTNLVKFENKDDNFLVQTYINKLEFSENEEIKIYSTLEYLGDNDYISIWSGEPYFLYTVHNGEEYFNEGIILSILKKTDLKKGEIYTIPFFKSGGFSADDPKAEFWQQYYSEKELRLPKGEYTIVAYTGFSLDEDQKEHIVLKNELKVIVN